MIIQTTASVKGTNYAVHTQGSELSTEEVLGLD
jgi:hypothetical protein